MGRGNNTQDGERTHRNSFVFYVFGTDFDPHFNTHLTIACKPQRRTLTLSTHVTCPIKYPCLPVCWIYRFTIAQSVCKCQSPDSASSFVLLSQ